MRILTALFLQISFVVLSFTTGILGGAPLLLIYSILDKLSIYALQFFTIILLFYFKLYVPALFLFSLWVTIHCYASLFKLSFFNRTFFSILLGTLVFFLILYTGISLQPADVVASDFWEYISTGVDLYIKETQNIMGTNQLDAKKIVYQAPSIIAILLAVNLWVATVFEKRSKFSILGKKIDKDMKNYRSPEYFIWFVIGSLLFSFLETPIAGLQEVALNILNISLLVYFFQGLSLLSFTMERLNFTMILRMIVNFLFIIQVLLPICLGILDFWLNFRAKISRKSV